MEFPRLLIDAIRRGDLALGGFVTTPSPEAAEHLAHEGRIDFLGVDLQHAAIGPETLAHLLRAIQAANPTVSPIVRVESPEAPAILKPLDLGFVGLVIPTIESREQAQQIVRNAFFPPLGLRSAGAWRCTFYRIDYQQEINDLLVVLPQIETPAGLENVERIAAVPGITGCLLGPGDLSISMGWPLQQRWKHAPYLAAARRIAQACAREGKVAAVMLGDQEEAEALIEIGFRVVSLTSNVRATRMGLATVNERLAAVRRRARGPATGSSAETAG